VGTLGLSAAGAPNPSERRDEIRFVGDVRLLEARVVGTQHDLDAHRRRLRIRRELANSA
jgi:hypothetical protein